MKTKTIEIYLSESGLRELNKAKVNNTSCSLEFSHVEYTRFRNKVTVEAPDNRTVEITEDEYEKAWSENTGTSWTDLKARIKEQLFKNAR